MRTRGVSAPLYPFSHSGPVLVCGNAWCLFEDLKKARKIFPEAPIIAVNGASRETPAFMLVSQHAVNFKNARWVHSQRKINHSFSVHSNESHPLVQYVWNLKNCGGSAWLARRIAGSIGFDQVILCGCPMVPGNYANHRPGLLMGKPAIVNELLTQIERDADWHEGCYSMSGATKNILGGLT